MRNRQLTITQADGEKRTIGYTDNIIMFLPRDPVEHFFRKHNGWAIDEEVLVRNPDLKVLVVKTTDKNGNPINYLATRDDIIDKGIEMEYHNHGSQYCLPLKYWVKYPAI